MKSILLLTLLAATTAFANQFTHFVGTYVPVAKSHDQSFGRADCATYGFSGMTEFTIYETSGSMSFAQKGKMDHSGSLMESAHRGPRFQREIYIDGNANQATRQELVFDFLHDYHSSIAITISKLTNGNYGLKYVSYFSKDIEGVYASCSSEVEVSKK